MTVNVKHTSVVVKLDSSCERCGSYTFEFRYKKPHVGQYCKCCGKYIKWLSKAEKEKYGITSEDFELNGVNANYTFIDDVTKHGKDYEESLDDEVPF